MCCLFSALALLGPRAAILVWYLIEPVRWNATFDTILWPILGFVFLPWTTLMFMLVAPLGVDGLDWLWLGIGLLVDIGTYGGGGYTNRDRFTGSA